MKSYWHFDIIIEFFLPMMCTIYTNNTWSYKSLFYLAGPAEFRYRNLPRGMLRISAREGRVKVQKKSEGWSSFLASQVAPPREPLSIPYLNTQVLLIQCVLQYSENIISISDKKNHRKKIQKKKIIIFILLFYI